MFIEDWSIAKFMNKTKIYWILQATGWSLFAIGNIILYYFGGSLEIKKIIYGVLMSVWFLVSTHIFRNLIIRWGWLSLRLIQVIPKVLLATIVLGISNFLFHLMVLTALNILGSVDFEADIVFTYISATMVFYLLWALLYFIYHYIEKYNASLKYEAVKNEIELNRLKSQLNPHFIFNALNSIRALVDENPDKAKNAITQLSSILRSSLVMNKNRLTSFDEEINAVKDYLELETIRFEERLQTNICIDPASKKFQVPPLMIQTLVENGIKHGISHLKAGGKLSIETKVNDIFLTIRIRNNGQLLNGSQENSRGFGIENTKQRLKLLYGNQASFKITNEDSDTVLTEIILPQQF